MELSGSRGDCPQTDLRQNDDSFLSWEKLEGKRFSMVSVSFQSQAMMTAIIVLYTLVALRCDVAKMLICR